MGKIRKRLKQLGGLKKAMVGKLELIDVWGTAQDRSQVKSPSEGSTKRIGKVIQKTIGRSDLLLGRLERNFFINEITLFTISDTLIIKVFEARLKIIICIKGLYELRTSVQPRLRDSLYVWALI